ncbi:hypothetical protein [Paraburkholderia aromaticivorans]|uniref:hypothetical protein n=1 Tax=Paraburkholderia aromaticivorans TaxID=2026199 RepID=UPI001455E191|nr:hypothetical protein [Paraburkholderia aromaticivorans]
MNTEQTQAEIYAARMNKQHEQKLKAKKTATVIVLIGFLFVGGCIAVISNQPDTPTASPQSVATAPPDATPAPVSSPVIEAPAKPLTRNQQDDEAVQGLVGDMNPNDAHDRTACSLLAVGSVAMKESLSSNTDEDDFVAMAVTANSGASPDVMRSVGAAARDIFENDDIRHMSSKRMKAAVLRVCMGRDLAHGVAG